ncbi:syntaxin-16-like [Argonauta hians]
MATRSLTEVFILMRNNALQSRHIFSEQVADDRMALVTNSQMDLELGLNSTKAARLPPVWVDGVEEVQYEISRIKQKMKELTVLQMRHLNLPTMDDSIDEEHVIQIQTQEITQIFTHCQNLIHQISRRSKSGTPQEIKLCKNIVSSLARTIQEMSTNFKRCQSSYLQRLKMREDRSQQYFDANINDDPSLFTDDLLLEEEAYDKNFSSTQKQLVEDNSVLIQQRESEIVKIVSSIQDLNEIFKDLSSMIVDQGTILDRIDYNVEMANVQIEKGLVQLKKAETHQKKSRKMLIITVLSIIIIILIIILIAVKN